MASASGENERIVTHVEGLDALLMGGLVRGAAYIVQGPPGAGKTILSNQICFNHTAQNKVALYISLLSESHERMMRYMKDMGFYAEDRIPSHLTYISAYAALEQEGPRGVIHLISQEAQKRQASLIIIDGIFVIHDAADSETQFRSFIHQLQGQCRLLDATMLLLTNQHRSPSSPEFTMVDGWIELLDEMHSLRAMRSIIVHKQRGGNFMRGKHFFRITDRGVRIFPRAEAAYAQLEDSSSTLQKVSTGLPAFDTMLHGGYPCASATLLYGPTGAGKTTIGLHFLAPSTTAEPGIMFGFNETPARLVTKANSIGVNFQQLLDTGALQIAWRSPAENLVDELTVDIVEMVRKSGAKRLFIDGLGGFKSSLVYAQRLPLVVSALNRRLRSLGVTVLWAHENRELFLPDVLYTDDISAIVDNVVLIHYSQREAILRRNISILKVRDSNFDHISEEFFINDRGVVFGDAGAESQRPEGAIPDPLPHREASSGQDTDS